MKRVYSLLFVLMLAASTAACNFGATTAATSAPTAANTTVPRTAPTNTPTNAPTVAPTATSAPTNAPSNTAVTGGTTTANCTPGNGQVMTTADELKIEDLLVCNGAEAKPGMTVTVHYTGTLAQKDGGTQFANTYTKGQPDSFVLGTGKLIKGLDEGITGMKVGSKRRLTIPPSLGYGSQGAQGIPANATLIYEIQLINAK